MNWGGTITLRASATVPCGNGCWPPYHKFTVEQNACTPLLIDTEKAIREKLQQQLDEIIKKFLEVHK